MIPVIGITSSYDRVTGRTFLSRHYVQAVEAAGGLPVILPCLLTEKHSEPILKSIDGLLLSGGVDVDPILYGEEPLPTMGDICPQRDRFELSLTKQALEEDMPIFGICRGIQLLNIAAGGNVLQDIGSAIKNPLKHDQSGPRWYGTHTIKTLPGSRLSSILGEKTLVNSFHHQSVDRVADGFKATAWSADGIVEGIESQVHKFVLGVQCHPECMWDRDENILNIFKAFVQAAESNKRYKAGV